MHKRTLRKPVYDTDLMLRDMAVQGLQPIDIARRAKVSHTSVGRFLHKRSQTPRMAKRLAAALRQKPERYLMSTEAA
jgi:transposase-like protein